ncbi:MAG: sugar transferase [Chloroflexi bacterium]|nr:sugar transferase [Chloroflexota bacterium]
MTTKRALDVLGAVLLLGLLLPVLLAIALMVRISSPGPILFRQKRLGRHGRPFCFYKFRTMLYGSDPSAHQAFYRDLVNGEFEPGRMIYKLTNDPRVTSVGRVLHVPTDDRVRPRVHR